MQDNRFAEKIIQILRAKGPLSVLQIIPELSALGVKANKRMVNSILYGEMRELVVRDRDAHKVPVWRIKNQPFEAAKGWEIVLYEELLKKNVINKFRVSTDLKLENREFNKTYHLDLAIFTGNKKFNIEADGFDHIRADARLSIGRQIGKLNYSQIDIDWMDNKTSYVDFNSLDDRRVFQWCARNMDWCRRYHEELLWPDDVRRNIFLVENGWTVMRLWNEEIKTDLQRCLVEIQEVISC